MSGCTRNARGGLRARIGSWPLLACLAFLTPLVVGSSDARAGDIETRDFVVLVTGKPSGEVHMTIHRQDDGTVAMRCDTDINVNLVIGKYKFIYRGLEQWKNQRLIRFDSSTDDNGKRYMVSATLDQNALRLKVNNTERAIRPDVWLTSYWCLPEPRLREKPLLILDADNGKELESRLQFVATEKMRVVGQEVTLHHYRVTGKANVDLWYDGSERLVRQEWKEQGHQTIIELVRVRR